MTTRHLLPSALCALLASAASVPGLAAEPTDGTATFKVTTKADGQNYDPDHVLAIWVTDSTNKFVKTLKKMADRRHRRHDAAPAGGGLRIRPVSGLPGLQDLGLLKRT